MRKTLITLIILPFSVLVLACSAMAETKTLAIRIIPQGTALSDTVESETARILTSLGYTISERSDSILRLELVAESSSKSPLDSRSVDVYGTGTARSLQQLQVRLKPRQTSQSGLKQSNYFIQGYMYRTGGVPYWNQRATGLSSGDLVTTDWLDLLTSVLSTVPKTSDDKSS